MPMASLPLDTNVLFMTIMATTMPLCRPGLTGRQSLRGGPMVSLMGYDGLYAGGYT